MKKNMKKSLTILISAVMLLYTLVGCGTGKEDENKEPVAQSGQQETAEVPAEDNDGASESTDGWIPEKAITIVVPYDAGGNTDIPTRIFAKYMGEYSDVDVNITNIVGAGGRTGVKEVMNANPDGYMLVLQSSGFAMQSALGVADFTYEDLDAVGYFLESSLALVVSADSPYETLDDLIQAARENPGTLKMGSVAGTLPLFAAMYLEKENDVTFNQVDLAGGSKAPELLSNRIDTYIDGFGAVKQYIDSGDFRCLAIFSSTPVEGYENIPTLDALGYKNFEYLKQNFGLWAPKGTDKEAIAYINNLIKQASENEDCNSQLKEISYNAMYSTSEEHEAILETIYSDFSEAAARIVQ